MAIIRVGINRDYTNINTAIGTANEGDIILIDPGNYYYTITLTKPVHLVGDTKSTTGNKVQIRRLNFSSCTPTKTLKVIVENLWVYYNGHYSFYSSLNWNKNVEVIFNKCYIQSISTGYYTAYWNSDANVTCINCKFYSQYLTFSGDSSDFTTRLSTIRHQVEHTTNFKSVTYQDYVTANTTGYGCDYGYSYFKLPSKYYFQGTVTELLEPVARAVKAYRRDNDTIMAQTTSNGTTGAYKMVTEYSGEHYLICRDDLSGEQYNDLVRALVTPAIEDYEENQWTHSEKYTLTIDHNLVDEEQFDFPLLIKLNSMSGINDFNTEDIFTKLTVFASRWSLQTDDGQQLYIEIIKWDHINKEAIAWTQVPLITSGEDTVLTLYYNALLPNNSFNIGVASNRLTSHLWGRSCIGSWHMEEDPGDSGDVRDSTYWQHHCTPYGLGSSTHIDGNLGKAIDFNTGYLKVGGLNNNLTSNMTLFSIVKFDDINTRGTIFSEGKYGEGWEVGISGGKLFSCISNQIDHHTEASTTLSGLNTDDWYLVTALIDNANSNTEVYLNGISKASHNCYISDCISATGDVIGTSYLNSPYDIPNIQGVTTHTILPITLVSGTVVSGTVLMMYNDGTSYYDTTGRHTFTEKTPDDTTILTDYKKSGQGSVKVTPGFLASDGINDYNYITINNNVSDFEFGTGDFTMSTWVYTDLVRTSSTPQCDMYVAIFGDPNSMDKCITLRRKFQFIYISGAHTYYYYLTIPNNTGGFILNNINVFQDNSNKAWHHLAVVRYNGTIKFYFNGEVKYSVYSEDYIPSPLYHSSTVATASFSASAEEPYLDYSCYINGMEIVKGLARWSSDFDINLPNKEEPDTFFSGQIDEVMLYSEVKSDVYIEMFNKSRNDDLINYT